MKSNILVILTLLFIPILNAQEEENGEELQPGQYDIEYSEGLVTVKANEADVETLLKEFAEESGIKFNSYKGKTSKITLDLTNVETEDFLDKVLKSYATKAKKKNGKILVSEVTVLEGSKESISSSSSAPRDKKSRRRKSKTRPNPMPRDDYGEEHGQGESRKPADPKRSRRRPYRRRTPRSRPNIEDYPPDMRDRLKKRGLNPDDPNLPSHLPPFESDLPF